MSDWEVVNEKPMMKKSRKAIQSDWEIESEQPASESLGHAAAMAIPRIGADILSGGYEAFKKSPEYFEKAKTEVPGYFNPMNWALHPIERSKQSLAGLLKGANTLANSPRELAEYAHNRLNLIPQKWVNQVEKAPSIDEDIEKYLGSPKNPGDALAQGLGRNVTSLVSGNSLLQRMPHLTKRGATKTLNKAQRLAREREIGSLNVNPELIEDARQFLPNILRNRQALESSHAGDYNSLFKLQSEVGQLAGQQAKSWFSPTERIKGRAGLEARGNLLDAIHENLQSQGHHDISDLLKQGQNDYRRYMKSKKYKNALAVAGAAYTVPKNPLIDLIKNIMSHKGQ